MAYNPIWKNWDKYSDPQFLFNKFWREPFYPNGKDMDWNDYGSVSYYASDPIFGRVFEARKTELYNEENERYWNDKSRNMGFDLSDLNYPISAGLYGRTSGPGSYISATESVINLFDRKLMKW